MPDLLAHYSISLLLATRITSLRRAILLALIGLTPDIDALFQLHRWATHSLIPVALATITLIPAARYAFIYTKYLALAFTLIILHVLLDLLTALTPILWPFTNKAYKLNLELTTTVSAGHIAFNPTFKLVSGQANFACHPTLDAPVITPVGAILAVATLTTLMAERIYRKIGK